MQTIPMTALAGGFTEDVSLEGSAYKFRVKWNYRGQYFTIDVLTKEGVELVSGMKIALNAMLLRSHPGRGLPPGELFVLDTGSDNSVIGFEDLGGRIEVVYATEAELAAI